MRWVALGVALMITACISTAGLQKKYVGKTVLDVVVEEGPPANVFDMGDGRRAFQWKFGGGTIQIPATTTSSGQVSVVGNQAWFTQTAVTSPAVAVTSDGCYWTVFGIWDENRKAWVVADARTPRKNFC